jgi:hypothetical protein
MLPTNAIRKNTRIFVLIAAAVLFLVLTACGPANGPVTGIELLGSAFALRFEFHLNQFQLNLFVDSLPVVLIASYSAFFLFGNYRGLWRYTGIEDLVSIAKAAMCATLCFNSTAFWPLVSNRWGCWHRFPHRCAALRRPRDW